MRAGSSVGKHCRRSNRPRSRTGRRFLQDVLAKSDREPDDTGSYGDELFWAGRPQNRRLSSPLLLYQRSFVANLITFLSIWAAAGGVMTGLLSGDVIRNWAKIQGESEPTAPATPEAPKPKRRISKKGMARIIAATKKRWAAVHKAEKPAAKRASAKKKMSPARKAALLANLAKARSARAAKRSAQS